MFGGHPSWKKLNEDGKTGTAVMQGIIRAFQIENGISTITGTVGPLTINAMKKLALIHMLKISAFYVMLSSLVNLVKSRFARLPLFYQASSDFINLFAFGVKNGVNGVQNRMEGDCSDERNMVYSEIEFWYVRDLMKLLGYEQWRNFENAISKAMESCKSAQIEVSDHFAEVSKMVMIGSGAERKLKDYMLTRYACYLIAQNGDPKKEEIAFAQSYFAVQTRKQELIEERISYIERTEARGRLRESEKRLSQNIYERGVDDAGFGRIRSRGDQALFGGKSTQEMKQLLGVKDSRPLADFLPTLTIAAKNLATEMTNYNVEEKDLQGENAISNEHVQNNSTVRNMLGTRGIKPEELPASEDIRKLERKVKSQEKKLASESGKLPSED